MSIQEIQKKINTFFADDSFFYAILIVLIAVISFGLGKLSAEKQQFDQMATAHTITEMERLNTLSTHTGEVFTSKNEQGQYVASKNSNKYHLPWCSGAKRISEENKIWFKNKTEAEKAGYIPAGNCKGI